MSVLFLRKPEAPLHVPGLPFANFEAPLHVQAKLSQAKAELGEAKLSQAQLSQSLS